MNEKEIDNWYDRIKEARECRQLMEPLWADYYRMYTDSYYSYRAQNDEQNVFLPEGDQAKLSLVFRNVEQTRALYGIDEPIVRAMATDYTHDNDREDTHRESVVSAGLTQSLKTSGLFAGYNISDEIKADGILAGFGLSYTWWRIVEEEIDLPPVPVFDQDETGAIVPALDKNGRPEFESRTEKQVTYEAVQDERISPNESLFDWNAQSINQSSWIGYERIIQLEELKRDPRFTIPDDIQDGSFIKTDMYRRDRPKPIKKAVRFICVYDSLTRMQHWFIEGTRKEFKKNEKALIPIGGGKFPVRFDHPDVKPFKAFIPIPAADIPCGISQVHHIKTIANEADKITTRLANITRQLKRIFWYRKGRVDPDQLKAALTKPDGDPVALDFYDLDKPEDVFGEVKMPGLDPDMFNSRLDAEDRVRKTSGIAEEPYSGADTATESDNNYAIGQARPERRRKRFIRYAEEVAYLHLAYLRTFAPPAQPIVATGADGRRLNLVYGRDAFAGKFDLKVAPGGEQARVSPVQQKLIAEVFPNLVNRYGAVFDRILLRQLLTKLDFPDIEALMAAANTELAQQLALAGALPNNAQGPSTNPNNIGNAQTLRNAINVPTEGLHS